ncbi:MAG: condensation domain-containing protein, partial [bacterium]
MQLKNVEDFYPLAPLQEGLLFHSLSDATSQMYLNQAIATLNGRLDVQAFGKAWQQVVQRYAILRSSFVWSGVKEPVQVVSRQVELPLAYHDLRGVSSEVQQQKIESMRQADIAAGFDPGKAPLMRLALVQTADDSHEFFWSFHHILMDGWSMFRVMKDAFSLYDAHCRGNEIRLAETPPYRNYIGWLRKKSLAKAEAFWREKLKGFSAPTPLAMDRISEGENAAARDEEFATEPLWISQEATAQLEYFAQKHHLTLSTITQGAWSLLLSRYSGESDVVFGAIVSGRPADLPAADDMVGLFINTLPVHAIVTARDTVLDWLQNFQRQQAEVRDYEYSPLAKVQQWSDVPPPTSLFDSIFMFENYRKDTPIDKMSDTLQIENIRWYERANYPLAALAIPENDRLLLRLTYHCDRFECAGIKRMLGHWQTLLEGIVTCPHHKIGELPLLKAAEKEQVCVTWNDTKQHFPVEKCAHELFEAHAEQAPEAIAVVYRDQQLTYGELNRRANRLAQHLQDLGIGPEKPVGICMERSLEMIVGMLAVLKAGGAYLPLDPIYPQDRLAFMLSDARAPVLLTEERLKKRLGRAAPNVLCLDSEWKLVPILREKVASKAAAGSRNNVLVDNLAYVIYTSGSTGKPKGVAVSHRGLLNLNFWHQQAFGVKNTDRATQVAGTSFDASVWEIWPYLTAGACLHLVAPETLASPENMRDWLATQEITVSFLPTPLAERVLPLDWPQVMALRYLLTGGDKLHHYPRPDLPF